MMTDTIEKTDFYESQETVDAFFDHVGKREHLAKGAVEAVEEFRRKKGITSNYEHLLDVGCGSGSTSVEFLKYFSRVTAVDVSEVQIIKAREAHCGDKIEFLVAPAENVPVEDSSIDVIVGVFALHHFVLDGFLKECHRILKPNGVIILVASLLSKLSASTESTVSLSGAERVIRMVDELKEYAEQVSHNQWNVLDRNYKLYQQITGFKKSRDDSKRHNVNMSLQRFKDYFHSIPFYSLPKSKEILNIAVKDLKREAGVGMPDDKVEVTVTRDMNIITLSKI